MSELPEADTKEVESGRGLIKLGAETLAGVAGAAGGAFLGPAGALGGAAAGPSVVRALAWVGRTIRSRMLSSNEEIRIGTALYVALERFKEREDAGDQPRKDGLFEPGADPRGALEGTLLAASRSYDETKVPFIGAFYASFVFAEEVSIEEAHFMLTLLDRLTYRQLCAMAYFADPRKQTEREEIQMLAEEGGERASLALLSELFELANLGLLGAWQGEPRAILSFGETYATLGGGMPVIARSAGELALTSLGEDLARMAELHKIPDADREQIGAGLQGF
jgi:hypothetical protein